jgi:hypothetical protein
MAGIIDPEPGKINAQNPDRFCAGFGPGRSQGCGTFSYFSESSQPALKIAILLKIPPPPGFSQKPSPSATTCAAAVSNSG